jgi:hypothetical protein
MQRHLKIYPACSEGITEKKYNYILIFATQPNDSKLRTGGTIAKLVVEGKSD